MAGRRRFRPRAWRSLWTCFRNNELTPDDDAPPPAGHQEFRLSGTILACKAPSLLAYTWGTEPDASHVRFELAEEGDRVRLTVTHSRVVKRPMMTSVSAGWHAHLDLLVAELEERAPDGFWRTLAPKPLYEQRLPGAEKSESDGGDLASAALTIKEQTTAACNSGRRFSSPSRI